MLIKYISLVFGEIFEIYLVNVYVSSFAKIKPIKKGILACIFVAATVYKITASILFQGEILLLCSFFTAFCICQIYSSKQYIKFLLAITYTIIGVASELLISGLLMITKSTDFGDLNSDPQIYAIGILLSKFITFFIILIIKVSKREISITNLDLKYLLMFGILPCTTIILLFLMYRILLILDADAVSLKVIFVLANMLLIISNIITFEIIRNQNKLAKSEYELNLLKNSIAEQTKHYEDLKTSQDEIRQMRHNMKSICIGAIAELKEGKTENALEQLQENVDIIEKSSKIIDTGHPSIDSVIENKLSRCDELNIHTNLSYQYKEKININEIEIAVIIGNILDNAIESCQKSDNESRAIWGTITADRQNVIINISNTANGSNDFKTSKKDKKSHGYGLKSISHIAKKYNGYASCKFKDNVFSSYVVMEN